VLTNGDDKDRVREATDLVRLIGEHVALQQRGREWVGLCPFHDDGSPSMAVVTHKGSAFYKCHACGAGGDAFSFVMNFHHMGFREALQFLADRAGIELAPQRQPLADDGGPAVPRDRLRKANAYAARHFVETLHDPELGAAARQALQERGVTDEMMERFGLGAAANAWDHLLRTFAHRPDAIRIAEQAGLLRARNVGDGHYDTFRHRLMFPIHDDSGRPIAFGARRLDPDDDPKYLNSPESPIFRKSRTLYGIHQARRSIIDSRTAIVTEGYTDVIACHQHGFTNVVGTLGTALTDEHAGILTRIAETVILLFDGDEAGQRAADRGVEVFFAHPLDVRVCVLPDGDDPDDCLRRPDGVDRFRAAVAGATEAMAYTIDRLRAQLDEVTSLAARERRLEAFLTDLARRGLSHLDGVRKRYVLGTLSPLFGRSMQELDRHLSRLALTERRPARAASMNESPSPSDDGTTFLRPARIRAERDLVALLLAQPAALDRPAPIDATTGTIRDWLSGVECLVPAYRAIIGAMLELHAGDYAITVQRVMDVLESDERTRVQVPDLYLAGTTSTEDVGTVQCQTMIDQAVKGLQDDITRAKTDAAILEGRRVLSSSPDALDAMNDVIEQIRRRGAHAAAIGQDKR